MTEQSQTPLIGPLRRRGWREIMHIRPLSNIPHVALVVTRQGRLAGVVPANDRRVLSDYITWPYDFREVDMRERLLLVRCRIESCDAGYEFDATLKLTYQVERPERVALELEDALAELESALAQSTRMTSRSFGVEQAAALEENLREALLYGDVLRERLEALGLGLRRADVAVVLDVRARTRAEALRDHMRERPLLAHLAIESLEPTTSFEVLLGGSYRLTSRTLMIVALEAHDAAVQEAIARTLGRIGIAFAPHDYVAAARAMAEALRQDALLQSELSAAEIELVRPTVRIQPDRQMIMAAQSAASALPGPASSDRSRRGPPLLTGPTDLADAPTDAPSWAALGAMFGRETPRALLPALTDIPMLPAIPNPSVDVDPVEEADLHTSIVKADRDASRDPTPAQPAIGAIWRESALADIELSRDFTVESDQQVDNVEAKLGTKSPNELLTEAKLGDPEADDQLYGDLTSLDQNSDDSLGWLAPLAEGQARITLEQAAPGWATLGDVTSQAEPATAGQQPDQIPALPEEAPLDRQRIAHWITLLQADGPALFKLWSMELIAHPVTLPTILSALTSDLAALDRADDPHYQHALVEALTIQSERASHIPAGSPKHILDDEPAPDWLGLRRLGQEEVQDD
jgi:hypothetical protein